MLSTFVHLVHRKKRSERIAVGESVNPIVEQQIALLSVQCVSHVRVLAFLSPRDVVYFDTALANHLSRNYFHKSLEGVVLRGLVNFPCVKWFEARKCLMDKLVITSRVKNAAKFQEIKEISELHLRGAAKVSPADMHHLLTNSCKLVKFTVGCYTHLPELKFYNPLGLLTLYLSSNHYVKDTIVLPLLEKCPHLLELHASDCPKLTLAVVRAAAQKCPELQEIHFNWSQRKYRAGQLLETPSLLEAPSLPKEYDPNSFYCELFRSCTQLKVVDFYIGNRRRFYGTIGGDISPLDVLALAEHCRYLTCVRLSAPKYSLLSRQDDSELLDSAVVQLVQNNPFIESLALKNFHRITPAALNAIAEHLKNLHTFSVHSCGLMSHTDLQEIRNSCQKLTCFDADSPMGLLEGASGMLQTIRLSTDRRVDDAFLERLAQGNSTVQTFSIPHCDRDRSLTSIGLCNAVSHWHNLHTFIVPGDYDIDIHSRYNPDFVPKPPTVDDSVLFALVQHCPLLTMLDISGNTKLTSEALSAIGKLVNLKYLMANDCKLMDDTALAAIAVACRNLVHIEIALCQITDASIRTMALHGAQKLRHISINYCYLLNNWSIQLLIRASRRLQYLCLDTSRHISFAAVAELPIYCPYMEMLFIEGYLLSWAYRKNKYYFDAILPKRDYDF